MNKAFTLIELLAVIAILAIILLIAVPMVLSTIASSKQAAFKDNAQMVIKAIDLKTASDSTFDYRTLTAGNITTNLGIDNSNYSSLSVTKQYGKTKVTIVGQGSWNGLTAYGTTDAMYSASTSSVTFADTTSLANPPEMSSNMIPVMYYNGSWVKADVNNLQGTYQWYNYANKMWANAVTVTDSSRSGYQSAAIGTPVTESDILTYMVWIPRYKYMIPIGSGARQITIAFENASATKSTGDAVTTYRTHPAFTFGSKELSGFWVSKFETTKISDTDTVIRSKPNESQLHTESVSTFFTAIRNMETTGNIYGFVPTEVDTHMIKNSEWGAIAYLTYSIYGFNQEVWIDNNNTWYNACAGATVSAASYSGCSNAYNTTTGGYASTTGNISGVYDMSGGKYEYVMGSYNGASGNNSSSNSGFSGYNPGDSSTTVGVAFPASKYYNLYTDTNLATACSGGICYGDALSETSGWNGDYTNFVSPNWNWLTRGGFYGDGSSAGIFGYSNDAGSAYSLETTRFIVTNE